MSRCHRALVGVLAAGTLSLPLLTAAVAAPAKKAKAAAKTAPAGKKADAKAGKDQFKSEGCAGCHKTKDYSDGNIGPDLSAVGKEKTMAQIAAYVKKPKSGSVMPAFKGPQGTVDNLAAYLMTQEKRKR